MLREGEVPTRVGWGDTVQEPEEGSWPTTQQDGKRTERKLPLTGRMESYVGCYKRRD